MVAWTDLFYLEVIDSANGKPVAPGEQGLLVMTPLWSNTITPFLRWLTGDIVRLAAADGGPTIRSRSFRSCITSSAPRASSRSAASTSTTATSRTSCSPQAEVTDFRAEAVNDGGLDALRLQIEVRRSADPVAARRALGEWIKVTFGLTPEVEVLEMGTLAREFEKAVKVPRFIDRRG